MRKRRKTIKRLILLCACLALCAAAIWLGPKLIRLLTATSGDYAYILLDDGTAEIRQYFGGASEVAIPAELDGHRVSRIGEKSFSWRIYLKKVTVPQGVDAICDGAFMGCSRLSSVELPSSVRTIGANAFADCRRLDDILIPDGVAAIGDNAFDGCTSLSEIAIPDSVTSIGANPFSGCENLKTITFSPEHPALSLVEGNVCDRTGGRLICCAPLIESPAYAIPGGVSEIGAGAFCRREQLEQLSIPDGVVAVRDHAFDGCSGLREVAFSGGVATIGNMAFSGCAGLREMVLPDGLTEIGYLAFYDCAALTRVAIPASVASIGDGAFIGCENMTAVVAPGSFAEQYCLTNDVPFEYCESRGQVP